MPSLYKILVALVLFSSSIALPTPQLAGEGGASDALLSGTDNAVGFAIENAEDNTADTVNKVKGTVGVNRRQLNKVADGATNLSSAVGTGGVTSSVTNAADGVDGALTSGANNVGNDAANIEVATAEDVGSVVPKF